MSFERPLRWLTFSLLLPCIAVAGYVLVDSQPSHFVARTLQTPQVTQTAWKIITARNVESGAIIPSVTNVIFTISNSVSSGGILRETLLGGRGTKVRYWGYCFPAVGAQENIRKTGFPGALFLSEAERAYRAAVLRSQQPTFSPFNPPTVSQLNRTPISSLIRHEKEVFYAGETCYVMSAGTLTIGTDSDGDTLNNQLEGQYNTDRFNSDTDGDGLTDGEEIFRYRTDALKRDSDGDGLIDGLEVRTGTNPLNSDTDRDGLCDGLCLFNGGGRSCADFPIHTTDCVAPALQWAGEDKNLDGVLDLGETDPRAWDSFGDGVSDLQRYYKCLLDTQSGSTLDPRVTCQ